MNVKKIIGIVIGIMAFLLVLAGLAYAYLSAQSSSDINGVALSTSLEVKVKKTVNGGNLIPMNDGDLGSAINYTTPCIDKKGYGACNLYTVTVTNNGGESVSVSSDILFTKTGNMDNLKWQELYSLNSITNEGKTIGGATNGIEPTFASTTSSPWRIGDTIASGKSRDYYIAVWISNTVSSSQNSTDNGSYGAEITFKIGNGEGIKATLFPFNDDSWATVVANVKAGTVDDYSVGDTKCLALDGFITYNDNGCEEGEFLVRIANKSTPADCSGSGFSQSACGFVIEFVDIINDQQMNDNEKNISNSGSWASTSLRTYLNNTIYNAIDPVVKNGIINTSVVTGYGLNDSAVTTSTDKVYLLSSGEIWSDDYVYTDKEKRDFYDYITGYDYFYSQYNGEYTDEEIEDMYEKLVFPSYEDFLDDFNDNIGEVNDNGKSLTRQLDYYNSQRLSLITNRSKAIKYYNEKEYGWWLRNPNPYGNDDFEYVTNIELYDYKTVNLYAGISPVFRLG